MKKMKKLLVLLLVSVMLVSCSKPKDTTDDTTQPGTLDTVEKGDYQTIEPFVGSPTRAQHGNSLGRFDLINIDKRLIEYSKNEFSTDTYSIAEGQVIDINLYQQLVMQRYSEENIIGLNPARDDSKTYDLNSTGSETIVNPVLVEDLIEKNFYKTSDTKTLAGISFALVMRKAQVINETTGQTVMFDDSKLYAYGQQIANQLNNYLRSEKYEVVGDLPIYITIYATTSGNSYLPGYMLGGAVYEGRSTATFNAINEQWIMLSSSDAQAKASTLSSQFDYVKSLISQYIPNESVGFVGKALLVDNNVSELTLEVTCGFKSYLEVSALVQKINALLTNFGSYTFSIKVNVKYYDETMVTMKSDDYQSETVVIWVE